MVVLLLPSLMARGLRRRAALFVVLVCLVAPVAAPPAEALYGFRITAVAPDVAVVGEETQVYGSYRGSAVPAPDRPVWLMQGDARIAETRTTLFGGYSFTIPWPIPGHATFQVVGDPYSVLATYSEPFTVLGLDAPGAPPVDVEVTNLEWGKVQVTWDRGSPWPGSEQEQWRVYRAERGSTEWRYLGAFAPEVTTLQDTVATGTWYDYRVRGWNQLGEGAPHTAAHRSDGPNATAVSPDAVTGKPGLSWRRLMVSWPSPHEPLGQEVEAFRVYRRPNATAAAEAADWERIAEVPRDGASYEDQVDAAGTYDYAVRGWNRHGEGPSAVTTHTFTLPEADRLTMRIEHIIVCSDGFNAGYQCQVAREGDRLWTYDDARVVEMAPVVSFQLHKGSSDVAEAPVDHEMDLRLACDGCKEDTRSATFFTDLLGDGIGWIRFGRFADPVETCFDFQVEAIARYQDLAAIDLLSFRVCD